MGHLSELIDVELRRGVRRIDGSRVEGVRKGSRPRRESLRGEAAEMLPLHFAHSLTESCCVRGCFDGGERFDGWIRSSVVVSTMIGDVVRGKVARRPVRSLSFVCGLLRVRVGSSVVSVSLAGEISLSVDEFPFVESGGCGDDSIPTFESWDATRLDLRRLRVAGVARKGNRNMSTIWRFSIDVVRLHNELSCIRESVDIILGDVEGRTVQGSTSFSGENRNASIPLQRGALSIGPVSRRDVRHSRGTSSVR